MSSRADVLGALLEAENTAEAIVRSNRHVGSQLAAERKKLAGEPTPGDFNAKHPRGGKGTSQGGKFIAKGSSGTPVKEVQKRLGVKQTGSFAFDTVAAVQNYQRAHGLKVDGVVGRQTAQSLLGNRNAKTITPGELSAADAKALKVPAKSSRSAGSKKRAAARRAKPKPSAPTRFGGGVVA